MANAWEQAPEVTTTPAAPTIGQPAWMSAPEAFKPHGRTGGMSGYTGEPDLPREDHSPVHMDVLGALKDVGSLAVNAAGVPINAALDLLTGENDKMAADRRAAMDAVTTPGAKTVMEGLANSVPGQAVGRVVKGTTDALGNVIGQPAAQTVARTVGDVAAVAPGLGEAAPALRETAGIAAPVADAATTAAARETYVPPGEQKVRQLEAGGITLSPSTKKYMTGAGPGGGSDVSPLATAAESAAGSSLAAGNVAANRPVINGWAANDIGLPRDTVLTPENVAKAKEAPATDYQRVFDATSEAKPVSPETAQALQATNAPDSLGRSLPTEHGNAVSLLSTEVMNGEQLADRISTLRQEGYKRLTPAAPGGQVDPAAESYGNAQLDAANALEKELTNRVAQTGNSKLLGVYQNARRTFAKIGTVERSLSGYDIDPSKVARMAAKSDALDGGLKFIADAYTHAPGDVGLKIPKAALNESITNAVAGGLSGAAIAGLTGHPGLMVLGASVPAVRAGVGKLIRGTSTHAAADELPDIAGGEIPEPGSPLGAYFHGEPGPPEKPFTLTPPEGQAFAPHQPSVLRTGENVPIAERGGLPPSLNLAPPEGQAFEAHQPGVLRTGEAVPAAESTQTPTPSVSLTPPPGQAFEAHPPAATSSQPVGQPPTAPQYQLPLGDQMVDFYHGGPRPVGALSNEHIGTGEGNQSFSHGHYVAEAEAAGAHYVPDKGGYLMKGQIPKGTVDRMLDWDKPIKDQPAVLQALGIDKDAPVKLNGINPEWTGQELHDALLNGKTNTGPRLGDTVASSKPAVSAWLASHGIPGMRYFDNVSRKAGNGTRNMVIFDPKDATILSQTKVAPKGKLGDVVARPTVGGDLTAEDLKLAE